MVLPTPRPCHTYICVTHVVRGDQVRVTQTSQQPNIPSPQTTQTGLPIRSNPAQHPPFSTYSWSPVTQTDPAQQLPSNMSTYSWFSASAQHPYTTPVSGDQNRSAQHSFPTLPGYPNWSTQKQKTYTVPGNPNRSARYTHTTYVHVGEPG